MSGLFNKAVSPPSFALHSVVTPRDVVGSVSASGSVVITVEDALKSTRRRGAIMQYVLVLVSGVDLSELTCRLQLLAY